jgi:3',5'-cyclic AMP phosphodiesterase CpdA
VHPLVSRPFLVLQLSDLHIGVADGELDAATALATALDSVEALPDSPDAVIVTGDLTHGGGEAEYEVVAQLLARLQAPTFVLPGNHDDRDGMRRWFGLEGAPGMPLLQAVDLGPLRLVTLDTTTPGLDGGRLDGERLAWLEQTLTAAAEQPTLLAMHHPPLVTGVAPWDEIGLPEADRLSLGELLKRHPQVMRIVGGHMHRTIVSELAGRSVLSVPSTYLQGRLDFAGPEFILEREPPGFAIHALVGEQLISHVQPVL